MKGITMREMVMRTYDSCTGEYIDEIRFFARNSIEAFDIADRIVNVVLSNKYEGYELFV